MANYDELFTFKGGDVNLIANYKGTTITGKVATQAMVLASPVRELFPSSRYEDVLILFRSGTSSSSHLIPLLDAKTNPPTNPPTRYPTS